MPQTIKIFDVNGDGTADVAEVWDGDKFLSTAVLSDAAYGEWDFPEDRFSWSDQDGFLCAGIGLAGGCLDTNFEFYANLGLGTPGAEIGLTSDASTYLTGHSVEAITPYGAGLGTTVPGNVGAVVIGTPGMQYTYGISLSEVYQSIESSAEFFANGFYDHLGRPYSPPSDFDY